MAIQNAVRSALFWKVAAYYGVLIASLLALVGVFQPGWIIYLPLGGPEGLLEEISLTDSIDQVQRVMTLDQTGMFFDNAARLFVAMTSSLIVMIPLRWVYLAGGRSAFRDDQVASGLLLLPLVITAIISCIKFSLPLAFALVGVLAGIRVRTEAKDQAEAHFTFVSIGVGLSIGAGYLAIGLVLAVFFALTALTATRTADTELT